RLAGAVWPNEADHLAAIDNKIQVGDRDKAAEMNRDVLDRQRGLGGMRLVDHGHGVSWIFAGRALMSACGLRSETPNHFSIAGTMPCGSTKTIRIINRPYN